MMFSTAFRTEINNFMLNFGWLAQVIDASEVNKALLFVWHIKASPIFKFHISPPIIFHHLILTIRIIRVIIDLTKGEIINAYDRKRDRKAFGAKRV